MGSPVAERNLKQKALLQIESDGCWKLSGCLNFACVSMLEQQLVQAIEKANQDLQIDLSGVEHSDSSAIALLVSAWRLAERQNISIKFTGLPDQLITIAQLSSLDHVLPLA
ncbi:STAS domain-containing protein [Pelagibaculum spongiae]|uniref:STAS domain-containing protein n=1 Tax=Pelagibaculum spongiae TaxID=2080658 RepID=A0A2V1H0C0_9GAMM|nr:STAS domain-containing protein [Pelagibaculum spongiae]PVZ71913.1 hypothetical protein DC094_02505 [Pelagibaculum spongiae]